jgi:hypothetical protein
MSAISHRPHIGHLPSQWDSITTAGPLYRKESRRRACEFGDERLVEHFLVHRRVIAHHL